MKRIEYVYLIRHIMSGKFYAGSSYSKSAHLDNFWVNYFTSSKTVKSIIVEEGASAFEILEIIPRPLNDSRVYEARLLKSVNAAKSDMWLNLTNGDEKAGLCGPMKPEHKIKISKAMTGKTRSKDHCKNISNALKGKTRGPMSQDTKDKIGAKHLGKTISVEMRKTLSEKLSGRTRSNESIIKTKMSLTGRTRPESVKSKISKSKRSLYLFITPEGIYNWYLDVLNVICEDLQLSHDKVRRYIGKGKIPRPNRKDASQKVINCVGWSVFRC